MNVQLGIIKALIGGLNANFKKKKPKIIIVFISKFDLLSEHHPDDTSSKEYKQQLLELFKEHIAFAKGEAKKLKIPCDVIIGSSTEKWNTNEVLNNITHELYKK